MAAQQLSENEIWDDSALVSSWNEALDEYKKYHSLAAKGERVEEVLDAVENEDDAGVSKTEAAIDEATGLPPWQPSESNGAVNGSNPTVEAPAVGDQREETAPAQQGTVPSGLSASVPQAMLDSTQDENLKNLLMSWYYAGYYTGLQEGQQKAHAAQRDAPK